MALALLYIQDGRTFEILKRDLATGREHSLSLADVKELLAAEEARRKAEAVGASGGKGERE